MKKQKKILLSVFIALFLISTLSFESHALNETCWYFKKNSEHLQPQLDPCQLFINQYSCYYVDKNHGDDSSDKVIYLTFDAGYENGNVEKILDTLKEKNVKAAFFVLSHLINNDTDLVKRMVKEGHLVCNHTSTHKNVAKIKSADLLLQELRKLEVLYTEKIGGEMPKYFRPPEGSFSEENLKALETAGYKTILWSFAYADWDNNKQLSPKVAKEKLINGTHNGEILLLHPTSKTNAEILGSLIDEWRSMGYRFGTLNEL